MDQTAFNAAKANIGAGKTYKEVVDSTSRVTDSAEKTAKAGQFCVRAVLN
jgi:hypothetical protein